MKKLKKYVGLFLLVIPTFSVIANDIKINFTNLDLQEARKKAGLEGKLLFIDFHAKWCTPCQWMEQTTFKDEKVTAVLNRDFVALKVDIDDPIGFEIKKNYDVRYLPTILIFNSQGQIIQRIEETLTPRLLTELLDKLNLPQNKTIFKHDFNVSPSEQVKLIEPAENSEMLLSREEYKRYFEETRAQSIFRVQVGVFTNYESASKKVDDLRDQFLEAITIINEFKDETPIFKIRMGQFRSYEEAESFRKILKTQFKMDGIVQ